MSKNIIQVLLTIVGCLIIPLELRAHPGGHGVVRLGDLPVWVDRWTGESRSGTLLLVEGDRVTIEGATGARSVMTLSSLTDDGQRVAERWRARTTTLNGPAARSSRPGWRVFGPILLPTLLVVLLLTSGGWRLSRRRPALVWWRMVVLPGLFLLLLGGVGWRQQAQSVPAAVAPFAAHAPKVRTRYDSQYLYVESDGIPEHQVMVGIRSWQQQVPVAQPYFGDNAWRIPLNPVVAAQPVSARTALFTGAIALAANGIPIFNALNNRGVDSYSIGELDQFGGHCGRADDYHYHAAPLHLQTRLGPALPIGYALDGFPLYGLKEPDGATVTGLDELNGHYDGAGRYHYHSTLTYPYINGGMRGVVTVSNDQIVPQPKAWSVRPATSPLNGATITGYRTTGTSSWSLEYTINGQVYQVNYGLDAAGRYSFEFVDPAGGKRTETYTRKGLVSAVSAASYTGVALGMESIASIFGTGMATSSGSATVTPLPTDLAGAAVRVLDSAGQTRLAPLFYVSPTQVNFQLPVGTSEGMAWISIGPAGGSGAFVGFGGVEVARVAPGIFTADASGSGYPAALVYRYRNGSFVAAEPVARYDQATSRVVGVPIDLSTTSDDLFLTLFGTGLRYRSGLGGITATIGGQAAQVVYAGAQGGFVGLDQLNLRLPAGLAATTGEVEVLLTVDGRSANPIRLSLGRATVPGIAWSMERLPDTGQSGDFSPTFGEDSDYVINPPAFQNNADGSLTDRVTGLQWQQADGGEMAWDGATSYCAGLQLAGRDDWRLPSLAELFSLNQLNNVNPALDGSFTRTTAEYWWSANLRADDSTRVWATNAGGGAGPHPKSETISGGGTKRFHARCVREAGPGLLLTAALVDNLDGTIRDQRSGLVWQQSQVADQTWDQAIGYCEALVLAGSADWRLPNLRELRSINDETRVRPSVDPAFFASTALAPFWTATTLVNQTLRAWTVDFNFGIASYNTKTDRLHLRCVRGGRT